MVLQNSSNCIALKGQCHEMFYIFFQESNQLGLSVLNSFANRFVTAKLFDISQRGVNFSYLVSQLFTVLTENVILLPCSVLVSTESDYTPCVSQHGA